MTYKPEKGSRQPVVLYDKDDKAIDVSGIEELSSVKIDTGKIAGDLELVKDNQGRLYGKYEETWIPVKVDSEGRPILASDVTVNAEGLVVDLGQIQQGPAGTEPWPVQLSGKKATQIDTILNAVSIQPGGRSEYVNMGLSGDERYVLVAVAIDKQPWAIRGRTVFGLYSDRIFFPHKSSYTQTYTTTMPMVTLLTGANDILDSYEQVLALSVYDPSILISVSNNSSEIATCTLKVVRKW